MPLAGLKEQYDSRFIKYLFGLVHPDYVQINRLEVKQPSFLDIPSSTISFKEVFNFKPNSAGKFALRWTPNFLNTLQDHKYSHLALINTDAYQGNEVPANCTHLVSFSPNISIRGYRLVSALLRIKYIGNIYNRSGMIYCCADYSTSFVNYLLTSKEFTAQSFAVDINAVKNGIWGTTTNVTEGGIIEALFLPTDPADQTFYPNGNFYGDEKVNSDIKESDEGARMTYIFAGSGLSVLQDSISVEVFYNFEVLPTPQSAPIVKASGNTLTSQQIGIAQNLISTVNTTKPVVAYVRKKIPNINNVISRVGAIAKTGATIAKVASLLI